ncbi:hypothetical protein LTR66_006865 [Elasticomyces elasticus]|nr:hypothetical protein LTR66_006865 [Elasticomyces elasticus]
MAYIYRSAVCVIIDIGEVAGDSDYALDAILTCSEERLYDLRQGIRIRDAVNKLYERSWFQRVWVLQEIYMANKAEAIVLCGARVLPWSASTPKRIWVDSREAQETEHWHVGLPYTVPIPLAVGNHQTRQYTAREDLMSLLCQTRTCAATDPRDKVFALFSLLSDAASEKLVADYAESHTTVQVYTEIATWLLSKVGISCLSFVVEQSGLPGIPQELPSWVPDLSSQCRPEWVIGFGDKYSPITASRTTNTVARVAHSAQGAPVLKARGLVADVIVSLCKMSRNYITNTRIMTDTPTVQEFVRQSYRRRLLRGEVHLALPVYAQHWVPCTEETRIHPHDWAQEYGLPLDLTGDESDNDIAEKIMAFYVGRQLGISELEYPGVVPNGAQPGDLICVLLGGALPFILRKTDDHFRLIGESYIYGLMRGEALDGVALSEAYGEDALVPFHDFWIW